MKKMPSNRGVRRARRKIDSAVNSPRLSKRGKGVVAVSDSEMPTLTADQVRKVLERVRR